MLIFIQTRPVNYKFGFLKLLGDNTWVYPGYGGMYGKLFFNYHIRTTIRAGACSPTVCVSKNVCTSNHKMSVSVNSNLYNFGSTKITIRTSMLTKPLNSTTLITIL